MTGKDDFQPIPDPDWPETVADMRDGFAGALNVYRTMAHHPALLRAWSDLREHIVNRSALGRERAEVVVLRSGVRLGSSYEWSQHILRARRIGFDDARIASLRDLPEGMAPDDALLCKAVDELFEGKRLSGTTLDAVRGLVGKEGVLDLMATVGFYTTLGFLLNSFETPVDPASAGELAANPLLDG